MVLGDEDGYADRSFGNLPEVQTIVAGELNAYDILGQRLGGVHRRDAARA